MLLSRLRNHWQDLIDGFWFIPGLVFLLGPLLAWLVLVLDRTVIHPTFLNRALDNPSSVRDVLSTISGGLISITALVFSITLITLQLVSGQFTPRALRGLLGDRLNQLITGGLVGIFAYCQTILISIRDATSTRPDFVPTLGVSLAFVLAFFGIILLLAFIGHTVQSIQIANIAARIAGQTMRGFDHSYPGLVVGRNERANGQDLVERWHAKAPPTLLYARQVGYIQTIALRALRRQVVRQKLRLHLTIFPGQFVTRQTVIAELWRVEPGELTRVERGIWACLSVASERDLQQDAAFGVRQLANIALRALSPAINDPTTAVLCIDYLCAVLEYAVRHPRQTSPSIAYGGSLVIKCRPFREYVDVLLEIGRYSRENARVVTKLLRTLERIATAARSEQAPTIPLLKTFAQAIALPAIEDAHSELDRSFIEEQLKVTLRKLET